MTKPQKIVLLVMILLGAVIFAFSLRNVSFSSLVGAWQSIKWGWIVVAVLCMVVSLFFEGVVVKILIGERITKYPWRDALRVPPIEQLFNGITPFASGGQPAQVFALMQSGIDAGRATSILLMKFIVYQTMIVINFIFCLLVGFHYVADKLHALVLLVIAGFLVHFCVIVGLLMVMYWYSFTKKVIQLLFKPLRWFVNAERSERWKEDLNNKVDSFYEEALQLKGNVRLIVKISLVTIVQLFVYYIIPYFILIALNVNHVNWMMVTTLHVLIVMVISLFPIPGGSGGAEISFDVVFSSFVGGGSLVLAMLLWRLITYYLPMLSGIIALMIPPKLAPGSKSLVGKDQKINTKKD